MAYPCALTILLAFTFAPQLLLSQGLMNKEEAGINRVYDEYELSGEGVLTVMMDRGIDYTHPDFIDQEGNTRIAYIFDLYDQSGANDPDNPYGVGTIYDANEINASLRDGGSRITNDLNGHGTATTGIFCGNGTAIDNNEKFRGVAYNSTIISIVVTKGFAPPLGNNPGQTALFDASLLPIAFDFASDKIEELGLPSVTLLNIGSIGNPTDGSTIFCERVDEFVDQGHIFVCGVGDDGGPVNSIVENLVEGSTLELQIDKVRQGFLRFNAWYNDENRVAVSARRPDGTIVGPFAPPVDANGRVDQIVEDFRFFHRGADVEFSNSSANWRQLLIDISGDPGTYTVILEPLSVPADGSLYANLNPSRPSINNQFISAHPRAGSIHEYASCRGTIAPSNYVVRNNWIDINGVSRSKTGEGKPGELWLGSSVGPTMDGRIGVDFVAPGEISAAAYSLDSYYGSLDFNILQGSNRYYGRQTAVSAAAPISAGVIALMLEADSTLSPDDVLEILQETAVSDSFTGTVPNTTFGYGKLDAFAAVTEVVNRVSTKSVLSNSSLSLFPSPASNYIWVEKKEDSVPFYVTIFDLDGQTLIERQIMRSGECLDISKLHSGLFILIVEQGQKVQTLKFSKF